MDNPTYVLGALIVVFSAACVFSLWRSRVSQQKFMEYAEKQPQEKLFFYSREEFIRKIQSCNDPITISDIKYQVEQFLLNSYPMVDEVSYTQTIIDIENAIAEKEKYLSKK